MSHFHGSSIFHSMITCLLHQVWSTIEYFLFLLLIKPQDLFTLANVIHLSPSFRRKRMHAARTTEYTRMHTPCNFVGHAQAKVLLAAYKEFAVATTAPFVLFPLWGLPCAQNNTSWEHQYCILYLRSGPQYSKSATNIWSPLPLETAHGSSVSWNIYTQLQARLPCSTVTGKKLMKLQC
jgi:hypothetical protein